MISILIPIYNTPIEYLKECFDSIDNQTFQDWEVVIVNDGSNEEVTNYLKNLNKEKYNVYHQENSGISKALNYGLQNCKYNLVARMDGDDIMLPERLEKQLKYFNLNDVDVLGTQVQLFGISQDGMITNHPLVIPRSIIQRLDWFLNHPSVMFKKDKVLSIGGYTSEFDGLEDLELWCRCLLNNYKLRNLPDMLLRHRRHNDNATVRNNMTLILQKIYQVRTYYLQKMMITG